jgi:hypothetical protein
MPDDPSVEEQALASRANIAAVKTKAMKKGFAKQKNLVAAKKKDFISTRLQPPEELTRFLQSDSTFEVVLRAFQEDKQSLLVRRYDINLSACTMLIFTYVTCRFLMCYLVYTNFQRQGAVLNMTAGEVHAADKSREYRVVKVWDHKTVSSHGSAKVAMHVKVYQLLVGYLGDKTGADLVFISTAGEKLTHLTVELEKLSEHFGKRFSITPTINRKQIATTLGFSGSEADIRNAAKHMAHSVEVHQSTYQVGGGASVDVER